MVIAYVLVKVEPGKEGEIADSLGKLKQIREAAFTWGFCDICLKLTLNLGKN